MSAVPPSCFDWIKGSGTSIHYGGATILTDNAIRTKFEDRGIVQSGAGVQIQFQRADARFIHNPSGWGNIAGNNY